MPISFKHPILKFIGDQEMVVPIIGNGCLLSHENYLNYYYPTFISLVDGEGMIYQYQKLEIVKGINWMMSLKYASLLKHAKPILTQDPKPISIDDFKKKVILFVQKTPPSKGIPNDEKQILIEKINDASSHLAIIQVVDSVSYWK